MNLLRKTYIAAIAVLGLAVNASAITLTVGDENYLGSIVNGIPAGGGTPSNEFKWLNELIAVTPLGASVPSTDPAGETLNRSLNDFGILSAALTENKSEPAQGTYIVGSEDLYLLGKYGAGSGEQASHVWYLGKIAVGTSVSLPSAALSHDTIFTGDRDDDVPPPSVPEGGFALTLLGLTLVGLGATRRFIRA